MQHLEGEGPLRGTPVASRIAIASTGFVAADRIGVDAGLGQYDSSLIDLRGGVSVAAVRKEYKRHPRLSRQLEWMGPLPKA